MGRWITHGDWYPDWSPRLFNRTKAQWSLDKVHEKVIYPHKPHRLSSDLLHYSNPSITDHVQKMVPFSDMFLEQQLEKNTNWSLLQTLFRPWWRFFRCYCIKRGFLDGFPGFYIACATAFATFVRYTRLYEHEHFRD